MMKSNFLSSLKQLSNWAKKNPVIARCIIALNRIILGYTFFYIGVVLADIKWLFLENIFMASALVYAIGFLLYPRKKRDWLKRANRFAWQKSSYGLVLASSCLFWLGAGNYILTYQPSNTSSNPQIEVLRSVIANNGEAVYYPRSDRSKLIKKDKKKGFFNKLKFWRSQAFQKLKARVKVKLAIIKSAYKQLEGGQIALLVLATLAIVVGLGYLTVAISCNLSCNGQEGAATAVLAFGCLAIAGILAWMWASAIKKDRLKSGKPSRRKKPIPNERTKTGPAPSNAPIKLEVINPDIQVCLETDDPKGMDGVTVTMNGEILKENMQIGKAANCVDVVVQPDIINSLEVTGANGPVKVSIEDGKFLKRLTLPMNGEKGAVELVLKGK